MTDDLKPCPFCGGPALEWYHYSRGTLVCCDEPQCPARWADCAPEVWNCRAALKEEGNG